MTNYLILNMNNETKTIKDADMEVQSMRIFGNCEYSNITVTVYISLSNNKQDPA